MPETHLYRSFIDPQKDWLGRRKISSLHCLQGCGSWEDIRRRRNLDETGTNQTSLRNASFWFRGTENNEDGEERDGSETTAREEEEASTLVDTEKGKSTTDAPIVEEVDQSESEV